MEKRKPESERAIERPELDPSDLSDQTPLPPASEGRYERMLINQQAWSAATAREVVFDTCLIKRLTLDAGSLKKLRMLDVRIESSNLANSNCEHANLKRLEVTGSRLTGLVLNNSELREVVFRECKADFIRFGSSKLRHVRFERCIMTEADFNGSDLEGVSFSECDLTNADFSEARLGNVNLKGSTVEGLKVALHQFRGLTIDASQALFFMSLTGINVV